MDFGTEAGVFLAYACGMLLICFFGKLLLLPVKIVFKLVINSIMGGVVLFCINAFLEIPGVCIPINLITVAVAGVLGVPGTVGMFVYFLIMHIL